MAMFVLPYGNTISWSKVTTWPLFKSYATLWERRANYKYLIDDIIQEEVTAASAAASSSMAPKHSVSRFQRCYSDGSQSSPNMRRKQLGSASQKVGCSLRLQCNPPNGSPDNGSIRLIVQDLTTSIF